MKIFIFSCLYAMLQVALSSISINQPNKLIKQFREFYPQSSSDTIPSSLANFGNPPYGSSMIGHVFYTSQVNDNLACGKLKGINLENYNHQKVNVAILLVDRGTCSFSQKVIHAQDIGAKAVIVVDNKNEDIEHIIMGDDGTGGNIYIPSFLISNRDGEAIKNAIIDYQKSKQEDVGNEEEVILTLRFEMYNPSDKVEWSI